MIWNETFEGTRDELLHSCSEALAQSRIPGHEMLANYAVRCIPAVPMLRWRLTITIDGHAQSTAEQGSNYVAVFYRLLK